MSYVEQTDTVRFNLLIAEISEVLFIPKVAPVSTCLVKIQMMFLL